MTLEEISALEQDSSFTTVGGLLADLQRRISEGLDPNTPLCCQTQKRGDYYGRVNGALMLPVHQSNLKDVLMEVADIEMMNQEGHVTFLAITFF